MPEAERLRTYLRRVTNELQASRQRLAAVEGSRTEPIAVVGMACRFPGDANDAESLWRVLAEGSDTMTRFPGSRGWDLRELATYAKGLEGAFVTDAYDFDAGFFGINPREAVAMDPQQRLLLQCAWEACEDAGIDPDSLRHTKVGVFSGVMYQDYATRLRDASAELRDYLSVAGSDSVVSGRISYAFGLEGPTLSVDTACSSSLVALHLAVQSLRRDECHAALVTGSMIMSTPAAFEAYGLDGALSSSGRCRAFSADADGTGWGEGVGTLYLERLRTARERGHTVLATIRGSAVNQDGASSGLTAPNGSAQRSLILDALADAGVTPADVDLIEAHGTGTRLGDPIEANSLQATYGRGHTEESPIWLGSIKSNIGHTQAASGVAGVMKVILALRHECMPRTLWISEPTDQVDWDGTVRLLTEPRPWLRGERVRRGCVSGFGFSGTNAHVIIEEGDATPVPAAAGPADGARAQDLRLPIVLSAASAAGVSRQAERLAAFLADHDVSVADVGRSVAGRHLFRYRAAIPCATGGELVAGLGALAAGGGVRGERVEGGKRVFFFPGQGAQWAGMGQDLLASAVFAEAVADCRAAFGDELGFDLEDWFRSGRAGAVGDPLPVVQPCLFTMMVGLARLWASVGITPDAVMSASLGEPAAFHVAGALSLEAAARIVLRRSQLLASISGEFGMLNVRASSAVVTEQIRELDLCTAAFMVGENSPADCTLAGTSTAIDMVQSALEARGITAKSVRNVGVASHSPFIEEIRDGLLTALADFEAGGSTIPVYSAVTGGLLDTAGLGAEHWYRNTRQPLLLRQETEAVVADGYDVIVEVSPHPGAAIALDQTVSALDATFSHVASLHRHGGVADFEGCLAELAVASDVPLAELWSARGGDCVGLPFYAFDARQFYVADRTGAASLKGSGLDGVEHPLLRSRVALATDGAVVLTGLLAAADHVWSADHVVNGRTLLPGTVFLELALRAADLAGLNTVDELVMTAPLAFKAGDTVHLQVIVDRADDEGGRPITIWSRPDPDAEWQQHCAGRVCAGATADSERLDSWPPAGESLDPSVVYAGFAERGIEYGDSFRGLRALWRGTDEVWAEVALPEGTAARDGYLIDPVLLDMSLHGLGALFDGGGTGVPFAWSGVEMYAEGADTLRVRLRRQGESRASVTLFDPAGDIVGRVGGLVVRPLAASQRVTGGEVFALEWVPSAGPDLCTQPWSVDSDVPEAISAALGSGDPDGPDRAGGRTLCYAGGPGAGPLELTAAVMRRMQEWLVDDAGKLVVCTRWGQYAPGDPEVDVAHAAVWGFVRAAQAEHPGSFALVDVDDHSESLLALRQLPEDLDEVVIRRGLLLEPSLARVAPELRDDVTWDAERVVLVTGAGGIGGVLARHLVARHGVRHLVLASRRGAEAPGAADRAAELREAGASDVNFVACDLADPDQVRELVQRASADRPLGAVVHTAGRLVDGVLSRMDEASLRDVFGPKVTAVQLLDELTRPLSLDAFVVCSSAAGTFGAAGQANYAAANSALDAACRRRALAGAPALSLAWGPWVADGTAASAGAGRRSGLAPIDFEAGADLFERALGGPVVQLPLVLDRTALRRWAGSGSVPALLLPLAGARRRRAATSVEVAASELAHLSPEERQGRLRVLVQDSVAAVLGYESGAGFDEHQAFRDLGVDSLTALQLRNRLAAVLGIQLPVTLVFEHPSIAALAEHLVDATGGGPATSRAAARPRTPVRSAADITPTIAIVAASCRFPGGMDTPEALWRAVVAGRDLVGDIPVDRGWDLEALVDPSGERPGTIKSGTGGFLERAYDFDAAFFNISPREGSAMDPLQRLSLELTWEALERSQIDPSTLRGTRTSVFLGVMYQDYGAHFGTVPDELLPYIGNGSTASVASGRIAYTLGLEGPAVTVDTACSSSLVAVHMAAQSLRSGESSLALAGGGIVMSTPGLFINFGNIKGISSSGRSKAFSAAADGAGLGEGLGMVLLERLDDAVRAGHPVLAILEGSAMNQDGASNGLTAPSGPAQEKVIVRALDDAGVTADEVAIVEAHGTGTSLGDPIEVRALMHTYGLGRDDENPLWVGSVKSNIGHTQSAAGVAGLIKMIGALRHRTLPPTLYAYPLSDKIDWTEAPVVPLAEPRPWPETRKRLAGVSAFGISGTNCHVILGEPQERQPAAAAIRGECGPIVVTGRTTGAASAMASAVADLLDDTDTSVADIAQALVQGRQRFGHHVVAAGGDREALAAALRTAPVTTAAPTTKTAFLFTGMAAQRLGMAKDLVEAFPVFADALAEVAALVQERLGRDVREVMYGSDAALLDSTLWTQVSTFAVQVGLDRLLASFGVRPDAVLGHSLGAVTAAYSAGVLDLADAVSLVCVRGTLMERVAGGAVASLEAGESLVRKAMVAVGGRADVAGLNTPTATVISGEEGAVTGVIDFLGVRSKRLRMATASHSHLVDPILDELTEFASGLTYSEPRVPVISNLDGRPVTRFDGRHWADLVRGTVRFADGMAWLGAQGYGRFLELGPDAILTAMGRANLPDATFIPTLRRTRPDADSFAQALGALHATGSRIDWPAYFGRAAAPDADLPTYPFQRERLWVAASPQSGGGAAEGTGRALVTSFVGVAGSDEVLAEAKLSLSRQAWLADHVVGGHVLVPGACWVELVAEAAAELGLDTVAELVIEQPLTLAGAATVEVQLRFGGGADPGSFVGWARAAEGAWTRHVSGSVCASAEPLGIEAFDPFAGEPIDISTLYDDLAGGGFAYGPAFQGLESARRAGNVLYADVVLGDPAGAVGFEVHPALLDAAAHVIMATELASASGAQLPFCWRGVRVARRGASAATVRVTALDGSTLKVEAVNLDGEPLFAVEALILRPMSKAAAGVPLHRLAWRALRADSPRGDHAVVVPLSVSAAARARSVAGALAGSTVAGPDTWRSALHGVDDVVYFVVGDDHDQAGPVGVHTVAGAVLDAIQDVLAAPDRPPAVFVTTAGVAVAAGEVPDPAHAAVWGLVRAAQSENPGAFGLLDLEADGGLTACPPGDWESHDQVAARGGFLVPELTLAAPVATPGAVEGTVLIAGGGAIAADLARHLADRGARRIVVASRRGASGDGVTDLVAELGQRGITLEPVSADLATPAGQEPLWQHLGDEPLAEVYYTAAVLADGLVHNLTRDDLDRVLTAKVDGAWYLLERLQARGGAGRIVLFSSAAGTVGAAGQANYSAANSAVDALAARGRNLGLPVTSVAFGLWGETSGMATGIAGNRTTGMVGLSNAEALDLLDRAAVGADAMAVAMRFEVAGLRELADGGALPSVLRGLVPRSRPTGTRPTAPAKSVTSLSGVSRRTAVLEVVRREIAQVLGHDLSTVHDAYPLVDCGFDSLMAIELRNRLAKATGLTLSPTVVFDHATPGDLAAALDAQLGTASRKAAEPAPAGSLSLRQLYGEALARGEFGKGTDLLELVGSMRPQFGPDDVDPAIITPLSRGEQPVLYCFNSCMATAGTHSYARFAAALNGRREVNVVALPGFAEGERLPSVMAAAVAAQVAAVRAHAGERPIVLLGTSAGGWFAHAAAVELERQGVRVAGSALVDCYLPTSNFLDSFGLSLVGAMTEREASFAQGDDTRLVASGWYTRVFGAFEPEAVSHPQLLLRATQPLGRDVQGDGWRSTWPLPHEAVDVDGNHFSIMEDNCSSTVEVLESWIQRLC